MERYIGRVGAALFLAGSALISSPVNADEGAAFKMIALGSTEATCRVDDSECGLETTVMATNVSGQDLYKSTWFTGIHSERWAKIYGLAFRGFDGQWIWNMSETDQIVKPGESIITQVRYQPPQEYELYGRIYENPAGRFTQPFYIDGYGCKTWLTPPDCIPIGGTHIDLTVNRIP